MDDHTIEQVERMIREGKTIVEVCDTLNLEWRDVSKYLHSVDKRGWIGAKKVITNRLKSLVKENDPEKREKLGRRGGQVGRLPLLRWQASGAAGGSRPALHRQRPQCP